MDQAPKRFRETFEQFKDNLIVGLYIGRSPINKILRMIVNAITFGHMNKRAKELGYDDVFHLYMLIKLDNGSILKLHKEATVKLTNLTQRDYKALKHEEHSGFELPLLDSISLEQFITQFADHPTVWEYDVVRNNCQQFLLHVLKKNGVKLNQEQFRFIIQDAFSLLRNSPTLAYLFRKITDLGAVLGAGDIDGVGVNSVNV